jgi:serine/threonine protein kinase
MEFVTGGDLMFQIQVLESFFFCFNLLFQFTVSCLFFLNACILLLWGLPTVFFLLASAPFVLPLTLFRFYSISSQRQGTFSEKLSVFYTAEICLGLWFLHERGVVYRYVRFLFDCQVGRAFLKPWSACDCVLSMCQLF